MFHGAKVHYLVGLSFEFDRHSIFDLGCFDCVLEGGLFLEGSSGGGVEGGCECGCSG